jgi:predicted dienelactone hydrolase
MKKGHYIAMLLLALFYPACCTEMALGTYVANATGYDPSSPLYENVSKYTTIIPPNGDEADIFYPNNKNHTYPVALLLQGANVDKSYYSHYAKLVAGYGFIVVVPNHWSTSIAGRGLFAEEREAGDVLFFMVSENKSEASPLYGLVDTETMVLLGHSYGGVAGLYLIQDKCQFPFCLGINIDRPEALKGAAFYGTNLAMPFIPMAEIDNHGTPILLLQGSLDGQAEPAEGEETFERIKDAPKAFVILRGANHYGITDINNPPGSRADSNEPSINQSKAIDSSARWSALFLRAFVLGDEAARNYLLQSMDDSASNVTVKMKPG